MNKEEIVKYIKEQIDKCYVIEHKNFEEVDLSKLLDYITNLQKENKELKELEYDYRVELKLTARYEKRIDKALDIIEQKRGEYDIPDELEKVLKGDE